MEIKRIKIMFKAIDDEYELSHKNFGGIKITYDKVVKNSIDKITSQNSDLPEMDLLHEWNKLKKHFRIFCELEEKEERLRVLELNINHLDDDVYSYKMVGNKKLEFCDTPLTIATPTKTEKFKVDGDYEESNEVTKELKVIARKIMELCERYIDGHRLQQPLFEVENEQQEDN